MYVFAGTARPGSATRSCAATPIARSTRTRSTFVACEFCSSRQSLGVPSGVRSGGLVVGSGIIRTRRCPPFLFSPPFSLPFRLCLASFGVSTYLSVCGCLGPSAWLKCRSMGSMTAWPHHAVHWPSNVSRGPLPDPVPSATPLQTSDTTERVGPTH